MPQKPSFHGKRSSRKQSSSQTHYQPCKLSCLVNLTQRKRSSQRTSAPSFSLPVLFFSRYQHTPALGEMKQQISPKKRKEKSNLSHREVKTFIHDKKKAIFHCKTGGYNPNQDAFHQPPRHQKTTIFRLRTGHCRLNSNFKRTGVKTSAQCLCGEEDQTSEHYLQSCSLYHQARQQIWPTCVSLKTKLGGSAEDLFLTSKYTAPMEETIWSTQRSHRTKKKKNWT